jgi:hypothetical protein
MDAAGPDWQPLDGPLVLTVVFTRQRPTSAPKRRPAFAATAPDLDKLLRSTCDAITSAGIWVDDARVVAINAAKVLTGEPGALDRPGARITISRPAAWLPTGASLAADNPKDPDQ